MQIYPFLIVLLASAIVTVQSQETLPDTLLYLNSDWNNALIRLLYQKMKGCTVDARMAVRAIFHEAATFARCKVGASRGGFTGSLQFEQDSPANRNLIKIINDYLNNTRQFNGTSFADLVALGGAVGIRACGGPGVAVLPGRVDSTVRDELELPGMRPGDLQQNMVDELGFTHIEAVAIIAGGHSIAFSKGFDGTDDLPLDSTPAKMDAKFLRELLVLDSFDPSKIVKLHVDMALLENPSFKEAMMRLSECDGRFRKVFKRVIEKAIRFGTKYDDFSLCPKSNN